MSDGSELDKVSRRIFVRRAGGASDNSCDGPVEEMVERSLRQCSGGERRRLALALALAYGELCASNAGVSCEVRIYLLTNHPHVIVNDTI